MKIATLRWLSGFLAATVALCVLPAPTSADDPKAVFNKQKLGPLFDKPESPVFSPDGKRLVYQKEPDNKRVITVVDQTAADYRCDLCGQPYILPDGTVAFLAVRQGALYRVQSPRPKP